MTAATPQTAPVEQKPSDKELNFRALEARMQKQIEQERAARIEAERVAQEALAKKQQPDDDEDDGEPYVDNKKLKKKMNQYSQQTQGDIQKAMEQAKQSAKQELKKEMWLENNADFYDVLQHAEKFATENPDLAASILEMPEGFERQKLVYRQIKTLGIHKPKAPESSIQQKIDANRKSPYYQPSGTGTAPYGPTSDFSAAGQKSAYEKMQALKNKLRI